MMIEVQHLEKRFKQSKPKRKDRQKTERKHDPRDHGSEFYAVRDVSFHCGQGDVLGLLGPNGAGKTTTLRMLSTALTPTGGKAEINGIDLIRHPEQARREIGFLSGSTGLYRRLSVRENIAYFGRLQGMTVAAIRQRSDELFEQLDMHHFADKKAEDLSTGMKQKANIARTVIHEPSVVVFDEPTTGLDVMAARTILGFIERYKANGIPVIFSTHHLHEVEHLCNRVTVINQGLATFSGTIDEFRQLSPQGDTYDAFVRLVDEQDSKESAA